MRDWNFKVCRVTGQVDAVHLPLVVLGDMNDDGDVEDPERER